MGGQVGGMGAAGGVERARRGQGNARHGVGPTDGDPCAPGCGGVRDAVRVELGPGDRRGRRAGADVADGVRAVHH